MSQIECGIGHNELVRDVTPVTEVENSGNFLIFFKKDFICLFSERERVRTHK